MRRPRLATLLALGLLSLASACGGEASQDDPVDAQEANSVSVAGLRYRVVLFRQLNPSIAPDDALYDGPPAARANALFAAFVRVCNEGSQRRRVSEDVHLEDAFGEKFAPQPERVPDSFEYRAVELAPGECLPGRATPAEQTFDGAALVFEVPIASARERPLILAIRPNALEDPERIQLDL